LGALAFRELRERFASDQRFEVGGFLMLFERFLVIKHLSRHHQTILEFLWINHFRPLVSSSQGPFETRSG
jgi:hypothetical protein